MSKRSKNLRSNDQLTNDINHLLVENRDLRNRINVMQKQINDYRHALKRGSMLLDYTGQLKMKPECEEDCKTIQEKYGNCLACLFYNKKACLGFQS